MLNGYTVIDADGHVVEPADLWVKRLPPELHHRIPHIDPKAITTFLFEDGQRFPKLPPGYSPHLNERVRAYQTENLRKRYPEALAAQWTPESHIKGLDRMGVDISFLYPTRGLQFWSARDMDPVFAMALASAYNDWLADFCSYAPARLQPVAGIPLFDPALAVAEVQRCARQHKVRGIFIRPNPVAGRTLGDPAYEPLWAECERLGIAVGVHEGAYTNLPAAGADRFHTRWGLHAACHPMEQMMAFTGLLEGGVLQRHPKLQVAFLESGCGWMAYWLYRLDAEYAFYHMELEGNVTMKPSEYFARQCYISCEPDEPYLAALAKHIGEDRLLFASDYPHGDHSPDITNEMIALESTLGKHAVRKILEINPKRLYGMS
ncbi:MAG: amidohydrolase [Dehalococcoidia bacterium]|nr:amidohydrolase [Dehalococcoidia bacterium]